MARKKVIQITIEGNQASRNFDAVVIQGKGSTVRTAIMRAAEQVSYIHKFSLHAAKPLLVQIIRLPDDF